jgi:hypothetical protein
MRGEGKRLSRRLTAIVLFEILYFGIEISYRFSLTFQNPPHLVTEGGRGPAPRIYRSFPSDSDIGFPSESADGPAGMRAAACQAQQISGTRDPVTSWLRYFSSAGRRRLGLGARHRGSQCLTAAATVGAGPAAAPAAGGLGLASPDNSEASQAGRTQATWEPDSVSSGPGGRA